MRGIVKNKNMILLWLEWHFIDATFFLFRAWKNILLFNLKFFSISFLLRTLFSYWHKYRWHYARGFNLSRYFEVLISNSISRFLGAIMRILLIFVGIMIEVAILIFGALLVILWIILPFITVFVFIIALRLIL